MFYKKLDEVKIPRSFWYALAGEITSVFGLGIWKDNAYEDISATSGLNFAIKMACWKLGLNDLFEYYDNLPWYDSDEFDSIAVESAKQFAYRENTGSNEYYLYLAREKEW